MKKAFTLVEILMALAITSIISLGLYSVYNRGVKLYEANEHKRLVNQDFIDLSKSLRSEISMAYLPALTDGNSVAFKLETLPDDAICLSFYSSCLDYSRSPVNSKPSFIEYRFSKNETDSCRFKKYFSPVAGSHLIGSRQTFAINTSFKKITCQVFAVDGKNAKLDWLNNYNSKAKLPQAVKFVITDDQNIKHDLLIRIYCEDFISEVQEN